MLFVFPRTCALAVIAAGCAFVASAQQEPGRLEFGFEQRVRNENWNNILDYSDAQNDEREQIRYRTRIWANIPLTRDIDFFAGLTQETNQKLGQVTHFDEVIFENAYLDVRKLFTRKLSLRIGRQNLIRGDGFILIDGDAGDGSRDMYMNAADLAYSFRKSKLELLAILDPPMDRMLPRINDQHRVLQNWTDRAYGAYFTSRDFRRTDIQAYYFYKSETGDITKCQPDRFVHTGGARVSRDLRKGWNLTGEFADQVGQQRGNVPIACLGRLCLRPAHV